MSRGTEPDALARRRRVVVQCAACGDAISWPVTIEPGRNPIDAEPTSGSLRLRHDREWGAVAVVALDSARIDIAPGLKLARTCECGEFVARVRTAPHAAPHLAEFPLGRITLRNVGEPAHAAHRS